MNINELIIDTLKPTNVPTTFQTYTGDKLTYITFAEYLQQGECFNDNEEILTGHYIQINVFSNKNYYELVSKVKKLLKQKGFIRKFETEIYEEETKIYHKIIRFFYLENKEEL